MQDLHAPLPWEPLWLALPSTQLQKHPHLPAAMVLLGGPLTQLACLLADRWQGLVTGTVIPATFLGIQGERESQPCSPTSPKPFSKPGFQTRPCLYLLCDSEQEA